MKPTIALVLLVIFGACETRKEVSQARQNLPASSGGAPSVANKQATIPAEADTFKVADGRAFVFEPITEARYQAAPAPPKPLEFPADSVAALAAELRYLAADSARLHRSEYNSLVFKPAQGIAVTLRDGPTYQEAEDSYEGYRYLESIAPLKQWLVEVGQYEGRHYLLIDQQTGKRTDLIGYPVVSPDNIHFVCANSDPTGYSYDGLQLWEKTSGAPPRLLWQRIMNFSNSKWGAEIPRWENSQTLVLYKDLITEGQYVRVKLY